jgi:endonuclease/exonuclease/phosphatase family metal-dependent hydrolase
VRNLQHRPLALPRRPWSELSDHAPLAAEVRVNVTFPSNKAQSDM